MCLGVSSLSHIARYAPSFTNPQYTHDRAQIDLSELLEPPYNLDNKHCHPLRNEDIHTPLRFFGHEKIAFAAP